jgi:arylsulfatase A-like enzyme
MPAYEPSMRIPLLIRLPGSTTPRTVSRLVLNTDLAPTIVNLASAIPGVIFDGRSLVPLMQNPDLTSWRKVGLVEHAVGAAASGFGYPPSYLALRTDAPAPRVFVRYPGITTGLNGELYDLGIDPHQLQNLYTDPARAAEVSRLNLFTAALSTCRGFTCALIENSY